jgi:hypothetical protein
MPRCADVCVQNGPCNLEGLKVLDSSPRGGFIVEEKMGRSTCVTVPLDMLHKLVMQCHPAELIFALAQLPTCR